MDLNVAVGELFTRKFANFISHFLSCIASIINAYYFAVFINGFFNKLLSGVWLTSLPTTAMSSLSIPRISPFSYSLSPIFVSLTAYVTDAVVTFLIASSISSITSSIALRRYSRA